MTLRRGEIFWVELDPVKGSEQGEAEVRPVGKLDAGKMAEIDRALKYNLGL